MDCSHYWFTLSCYRMDLCQNYQWDSRLFVFYCRLVLSDFTVPFRITMMTSSNGNIFRATGPLCGDSTGHRWSLLTKASDAELWCFLYVCLNKRLSKQSGCRCLRRRRANYDVTAMYCCLLLVNMICPVPVKYAPCHFLVSCKLYEGLRVDLYDKVSKIITDFYEIGDREKFVRLMNSRDNNVLTWLGKFLYTAQRVRGGHHT